LIRDGQLVGSDQVAIELTARQATATGVAHNTCQE
jgi:hypothetical protein